jgi:hypothetical protein
VIGGDQKTDRRVTPSMVNADNVIRHPLNKSANNPFLLYLCNEDDPTIERFCYSTRTWHLCDAPFPFRNAASFRMSPLVTIANDTINVFQVPWVCHAHIHVIALSLRRSLRCITRISLC